MTKRTGHRTRSQCNGVHLWDIARRKLSTQPRFHVRTAGPCDQRLLPTISTAGSELAP